jgi:1-aminocyclopropane-1-carboxylate deaminase/D-cysteine desulfhydrase-like pyridoxal-dependent ACC family enzyme
MPPVLDRPLLTAIPSLRGSLPWIELGELPTRVERLDRVCEAIGRGGADFYVKRDDASAPAYGGNKVRTLEVLFGEARSKDATHIFSTGAFGSNHATAAVIHAPRAGFENGVILFPQPRSWAALENLRVILSRRPVARVLPHWSFLPYGMWSTGRTPGMRPYIMPPGGATPRGALGYVSAALELAEQVSQAKLPVPRTVAIGVGSTCTSAGLLLGFRVAARLGLGWQEPPRLVSVRVTPWPVTAHSRIVSLAVQTSALLASMAKDERFRFSRRELGAGLRVDGRFLGRGYGYPTPKGEEAIALFREHAGMELDTTYSAKSAAGAMAMLKRNENCEPLVYWATKSTMPMPEVGEDDWRWAHPRAVRWIERCAAEGLDR